MQSSLFLAKLIGPYIIVVSLAFLFNRRFYQNIFEDFCKNPALIYLAGIYAFFLGFLVVLFHNVWVGGWQVIITIFGWLSLIKGAWLILLPNTVVKFIQIYKKKTVLLTLNLVIALAFGIFLAVKGYGLAVCPLIG